MKDPLDIANGSGFLFQLLVEETVKAMAFDTPWEVIRNEFPYRSGDGINFVDLVIRHGTTYFFIEVKRVKEATPWVGLCRRTTGGHEASTDLVKGVAAIVRQRSATFRRINIHMTPASPEVEFCVIPGDKDRRSFEHIAGPLVASIGAVCRELKGELERNDGLGDVALIPLVVTNASLHVSAFDPMKVSPSLGTVDPRSSETNPVGVIRVTKPFSAPSEGNWTAETLKDMANETVHTVLVVSGDQFEDFLRHFHMTMRAM